MVITRNWIYRSATVDGHLSASPLQVTYLNAGQLAGSTLHLMPSKRDREVPYGMKGGEQNGH
jgi:hypothetical protein